MLFTYFKLAWRNLFKNPVFSFINISGLAIGMACTMLIFLWVYYESSWNKDQKNYNSVYHVLSNRNFNGEVTTGSDMMYPLAKAAKDNLPGVQAATIVSFGETTLFSVGDKRLNKRTITVSPDFFKVFSYELLYGSVEAVKDADAILISESTAKALFDHINVIDQPVEVNNGRTAFIKAVVKDVPQNSTLQFDALVPFNPSSPQLQQAEQEWVNCGHRIFLKTVEDADVAALEKGILQLIQQRTDSDNPTTRGSIILHPMAKWQLYSEFEDGKNVGGRIEYVRLFTWIAVVILLIACVNFMNLSTARSEKRAKEVGIRKTLGSARGQLLWQFIGESMMLSMIAFVFAMLMVWTLLPLFNQLLAVDIRIPYEQSATWLLALGIVLITGVLAGSYPAFYLSGFNPLKVLKGTFLPGKKALMPRKVLVTVQFAVSMVLISATLIIYQQLQYVQHRDLGYDQDNLIMVKSSRDTDKNFDALRNDLLQTGYVQAVGRSSSPVTDIWGFTSGVRWTGAAQNDNFIIGFLYADEGFTTALNTKVVQGRTFRKHDSTSVLFNKEAIRLMGLKSPIGTEITWAGNKRTIVGVIDNMVMTSPYEPPSPLMVNYSNDRSGQMNIRLAQTDNLQPALAAIEKVYKQYSIEYPFEYRFIDEAFNEKFVNEQLLGKLSVIFATLAIFICCLGLFGLVASAIERRTKEIGIRKVLGASLQSLLLLISKDFLWLVVIAFAIAIPIAWWAMSSWLQSYTYRTTIHLYQFAIVGFATLVIALITISLNASKAALSNPAKTLRTE